MGESSTPSSGRCSTQGLPSRRAGGLAQLGTFNLSVNTQAPKNVPDAHGTTQIHNHLADLVQAKDLGIFCQADPSLQRLIQRALYTHRFLQCVPAACQKATASMVS